MTTPTQAQAALSAIYEISRKKTAHPIQTIADIRRIAAQVGEPQHSVDFLEGVAEGKAATIERCAQVLDEKARRTKTAAKAAYEDGAAEIRKLKDEL